MIFIPQLPLQATKWSQNLGGKKWLTESQSNNTFNLNLFAIIIKQFSTSLEHCNANVLAEAASSSCWAKSSPSLTIVPCDMMVVATWPTASVGVKNLLHDCINDSTAWSPSSVAHVTIHRTISRRRQFSDVSVIRITCSPSWNATLIKVVTRTPSGGMP